MHPEESSRFPKRVRKRYAEILLREIHQRGGRERYVPVAELEETLGLEEALILELCRTRLLGEVQIADRLPADVEDSAECRTALEREWLRCLYSRPHVRIRPAAVRLTEEELLRGRKRKE